MTELAFTSFDALDISIHTPARGVTDCYDLFDRSQSISIHTPARGVTMPYGHGVAFEGISIHTPARGVTQQAAMQSTLDTVFQSTLPHGE